ncbi:MAG: hypothetical protein PUB19_08675 [Lachnospiraceae bacterium]|nr:hypothetical protein [Lachnospiraceae bacterium]
MRIKIKHIMHIVAFAIIFFMIFNYATFVIRDKSGAQSCVPFYDMDEDADVLFLGTSVTFNGISPLDLWNEYGMVSFNLANEGHDLANSYWALKEALNYQQPKVVVIDVSYLTVESSEPRVHVLLDNMPFGLTKLQAICDLTPKGQWRDYVFPLMFYHGNWENVTTNNFQEVTSINYGATVAQYSKKDDVIFDTSVFAQGLTVLPEDDVCQIPERALTYIDKITALCKENNIQLLFVNYPSYATGETNHGNGEELQRMWNAFSLVADENDVDYLNCLHLIEDIGFDYQKDLRDWRHLSVYGNQKMTSYIGAYIMEHYDVSDRRGEESLAHWNDDYVRWEQYRQRVLEGEN